MARTRLIGIFGTLVATVAALAALAGSALATPVFLSAQDVSDAGQDAFQPQVAVDASGNSLMVWTRFDGSDNRIQAKFRASNGTWGPTQTISDPGMPASEPQVAFDNSGNALAVWTVNDGSNTRVQAASRPVSGSFGAPQSISGAGLDASRPQLSFDNTGKAVVVWERTDGTNLRIEASVRSAAGAFSAPQILSDAGQDGFEPAVAAGPDADSNAAAVWTRSDGVKLRVQASRRRDVVGFARPKGATPLRASLVPAFKTCTTPNRSHGAPLSFPSCNPPITSSSVLEVGSPDSNGFAANSISSVKLDVLAGNPANNVDDADVKLTLSMTDVRNNPSGTDYVGRVLATAPLQITDRLNATENPETGTVQTIPLQFPADCVATGSSSVGGTCSANTTLDAISPGTVVEGQRSIWELGQLQVMDAGPNGTGYASCPPTCGDGDETVFMRQGVFVP
jgi:hypothetical protein